MLWYRDDGGRHWVGGWRDARDADVFEANEEDLRVLDACDGAPTAAELEHQTGMRLEDIERVLRTWETRLPSSFAWKPIGIDERRAKQSAIALDMLLESRAVEHFARADDNSEYHRKQISDATHQFDEVETTVSHAYSVPHPALGGLTYGESFFHKCFQQGAVRAGARILEIGCGTGRFARSFLDALEKRIPDVCHTLTYTMFDLAPALTASQREVMGPHGDKVTFENGDIETHSFSQQFDLVLANEMIADLGVEVVDRDRILDSYFIRKYKLSCEHALRRFMLNTGAIRLVEQIASLLRPGGYGVVTEYGSRDAFPVAVELQDHTEYSIHFQHLEQVARALGLEPHCESLLAFLPFDLSCEVIAGDSLALLKRLAHRLFGRSLPALAYTYPQLRESVGAAMDRVGHLRFVQIRDPRSAMFPGEFQAFQLFRK